MHLLLPYLASIAAVIGPVVTLVGLIQSRGWLAGIGTALACISIFAILYARRQRLRTSAASIEIEGISIDALNAANLRRRVSSRFFIQTVHHDVTIDPVHLATTWRYAGYCRVDSAAAFEFSVDSESSIPFNELDCYGFDLKRDPERKHAIRPVLIGPDSISKKIALPFLEPLRTQEAFDIELKCRLPAPFKVGVGYYLSTLSFDQDTVGNCSVNLTFHGRQPEWVRVYECADGSGPKLIRNLTPAWHAAEAARYTDIAENRAAQSARVYMFERKGD